MEDCIVSKLFVVCFLVILILLSLYGYNMESSKIISGKTYVDEIANAYCAKLEYCEFEDNEIFITSEINTLSNVFLSIDIVHSDKIVSKWIYRITFNCAELSSNKQEIVVIIGSNAMSINGEVFSTPKGIPFKSIVDIFTSKYKYFAKSDF